MERASRSRPLRDSPSIRAHDSSAGPEENCAASAQGSLAGRSRGPQQNSNFPFISAASLAILKGWRSAVGSQANWIWASSSRAREGRPDGGGAAEDPGWAQCERPWSLKPDPEVTTLSSVLLQSALAQAFSQPGPPPPLVSDGDDTAMPPSSGFLMAGRCLGLGPHSSPSVLTSQASGFR